MTIERVYIGPTSGEKMTVAITVRLSNDGLDLLDKMRGRKNRADYIRSLIAAEHDRQENA